MQSHQFDERVLRQLGEHGYGKKHKRRNADITDAEARQKLLIDPGPQVVNATTQRQAAFRCEPSDTYSPTFPPQLLPNSITTLGDLKTDKHGRLLVLGGHGNSGTVNRGFGHPRIDTYANTGGASLLTHVVPLDETLPWPEQNRRAVALALGERPPAARSDPLADADREFATRLLASLGLAARRPLVGVHPSGGRLVKQWDVTRWGAVAARLQREFGATVLVTGTAAEAPLARDLARRLEQPPVDLSGRLSPRELLALVERLDLFLSPDTGPMHMACAVGTPSVSVFGPSDPVRYFSGGDGAQGSRHVVVRQELWCSPCNLVRNPPAECAGPSWHPRCTSRMHEDRIRDDRGPRPRHGRGWVLG